MHSRLYLLLALLILCLGLCACSGKASYSTMPVGEQLERVDLPAGKRVHVEVGGAEQKVNEDMKNTLESYLLSERMLMPVSDPADADARIKIELGEVFSLDSGASSVKATSALGGTAMGAGLGALLGSAIGRSGSGTAWGAGIGALAGLGAVLLDSRGRVTACGLRAKVGINAKGGPVADSAMRNLAVRADGDYGSKEAWMRGLEESLSRTIMNSIASDGAI